jgi:hypothetical protein
MNKYNRCNHHLKYPIQPLIDNGPCVEIKCRKPKSNRNKQQYSCYSSDRLCVNDRPEIDFEIEPQELLRDLRIYAMNHGIDYDKYLPRNAEWLSRKINSICNDLVQAGLVKEPDIRREHRRFIRFKKIKRQQTQNSGLKTCFT